MAVGTLATGQAQAISVNVNDIDYDVTTFTGTYNDNISKFATAANGGVMPWWGSNSLATEFASAVQYSLGSPNNHVSPFFGFYLVWWSGVALGGDMGPSHDHIGPRPPAALRRRCCLGV
jgi:hypothetical protein